MTDRDEQELQDDEVEQKLVDTVKNVRFALERVDESAANDPSEIKKYIEDKTNHVAIRREVEVLEESKIEQALKTVQEDEIPPFEPVEGVYPFEHMMAGTPLTNLDDYLKYRPVGIHHAQGGVGSKGSYIVAAKRDAQPSLPTLVVLKEATPNAPLEVFASKVMRRMGLVSPRFKVLSPQEFQDFAKLLRSAQVTISGSCTAIHEPSAWEMGGLLMDYLTGKTLTEVGHDESVFNYTAVLRDIGRCMAVDTALNCLDRIPLVWNNSGNASNLLIATDTHEVHVIDSAYNRVLHEESFHEKLDRIRAAVQEAKTMKLGQQGEHTQKVKDFFSSSTQGRVNLTEGQLYKIFSAFIEGCEDLVKTHRKVFAESAQETREAFERAGCADKFNLDESLHLDFCTAAVEEGMRKVLQSKE